MGVQTDEVPSSSHCGAGAQEGLGWRDWQHRVSTSYRSPYHMARGFVSNDNSAHAPQKREGERREKNPQDNYFHHCSFITQPISISAKAFVGVHV